MSGIAAILGYDSNHSKQLIEKMCRALKHRGPDYSGTFLDFNVALGNVASNTSFLSFCNQPLSDRKKKLWITFDGYLSNNGTLTSKQGRRKSRLISDAECVIDAYERYGKSFICHLEGFFAFCLWDSSKGQLIIARDRFGAKPLYYFRKDHSFLVASELKALFVDETIPRIPNHTLICSFLLGRRHERNGQTFFDGIKEVLPGYYLCFNVRKNEIQECNYWHLPKTRFSQNQKLDYSDEFLRIFRQAIEEMLPSDCLFATSIAGLDSQAIASVIDSIVSPPNISKHIPISAVFGNASVEDNEEPYVREYARFRGTKVHYVALPDSLTWSEVKNFVFAAQVPCYLNCYIYWSISKELSKKGIKVAFLGLGADPLLWGRECDGNLYLRDLWKKKDIGMLINETIGMLLQQDISHKFFQRVAEVARNNLLPVSIVSKNSDFLSAQYVSNNSAVTNNRLIDQMTADISDYLVEADRLFSANSVEPRNPFLNKNLVEFVLSLPPNQKIRRGVKKFVLRKAMKNYMPDSVLECRRKFPTPVPTVQWLMTLRPEITQMLESKIFRNRQIFNDKKILQTYLLFCDRKLDLTEIRKFSGLLWRIINIELWFEIYIDNTILEDVHFS